MSIHISAKPGEIEKIVLLAGDPLRAKYIAENFLQNIKLVSSTRSAFYFTGSYKGTPVTIGTSGMSGRNSSCTAPAAAGSGARSVTRGAAAPRAAGR